MAAATATGIDPTASAARRRVAVACGLAILLCAAGGLAAWNAGWFGRPIDPRLVELRLFQDELVKKYPPEQGPKNVIEAAERAAAVGQFMLKVQALPAELRPEAMRGGAAVMMQAMNAKMNTYFALPREQRQAFLDGEIAQQELMRKAFAAGQSMMKIAGMGKTAGQGGPADGRPMGPGGGSIEDRNRMRKGIIDRTSPQQRSRFSEYTGSLERRRHERGLPPMPFGP
jgi:hypothetical protein